MIRALAKVRPKRAIKNEGLTCIFCGARDPDSEEICPNTANSRHTLISGNDKELWGQGHGDGPGKHNVDYEPSTRGWDGDKNKKIAADLSGDEVASCPFCGSGNVWGGSNGDITCELCGKAFQVLIKPAFPGMPSQLNGQDYNIDGSIAGPTGQDVQDSGMLQDVPEDQDEDDEQPGSPQDEETPQNGSAFQASKKFYLTDNNSVLHEAAYLDYLAEKYL